MKSNEPSKLKELNSLHRVFRGQNNISGLPWPLQVGEDILLFRHLILAGLNKWLESLHDWWSN